MHKEKQIKDQVLKYVWHSIPYIALCVWGALCLSDQLWYDEAFSAGMVMQTWTKLLRITAIDDHSPFYYAILKLFYLLCGTIGRLFQMRLHLNVLKIFSLIFMAGYIFLGKYYVAKLFGQRISIWFMLFSVLAPLMSIQAGNVRMYSMALFFLTLDGLLAYDLYREDNKRKWVWFTIAGICVVYCHTFAMIQAFWFYGLFMFSLIRSRQFEKLKRFLVSGAVVSLAFSPWLFVTFRQMQLRMRDDVGSTLELAGTKEIREYFREWLSASLTPIDMVVWVKLGIVLVLLCAAMAWMREHKVFMPAMGIAAFVLTSMTGFLVSAFLNNCFLGRYAFPGFGFWMLVLAMGFNRIWDMGKRGKIAGALILTALLVCFWAQYRLELQLEYDGGLEKYEQFWEENVKDGDVWIGAQGHTIFLSVYHPEQDYYIDGYAPADLSFPHLESCYDVSRLVQEGEYNTWYIDFAGSPPTFEDKDLICEPRLLFG